MASEVALWPAGLPHEIDVAGSVWHKALELKTENCVYCLNNRKSRGNSVKVVEPTFLWNVM